MFGLGMLYCIMTKLFFVVTCITSLLVTLFFLLLSMKVKIEKYKK